MSCVCRKYDSSGFINSHQMALSYVILFLSAWIYSYIRVQDFFLVKCVRNLPNFVAKFKQQANFWHSASDTISLSLSGLLQGGIQLNFQKTALQERFVAQISKDSTTRALCISIFKRQHHKSPLYLNFQKTAPQEPFVSQFSKDSTTRALCSSIF